MGPWDTPEVLKSLRGRGHIQRLKWSGGIGIWVRVQAGSADVIKGEGPRGQPQVFRWLLWGLGAAETADVNKGWVHMASRKWYRGRLVALVPVNNQKPSGRPGLPPR